MIRYPNFPSDLHASDINGVIESLTRIIVWAKTHHSRHGYFAAMYRTVTMRVKEGIQQGEFEDGPRMERLDVVFANRYLDAVRLYADGRPCPLCWTLAFDAAQQWRPVVLQHLVLGMTAHIGFDLAIAAVETVEGNPLDGIRRDFDRINGILYDMVDRMQMNLAGVWPALRWMDVLAGRKDEWLSGLGIMAGRGLAWQAAEELAMVSSDARAGLIHSLDARVAAFGKTVLFLPRMMAMALLVVRLTERQSISRITHILEG